MIYILEIPHQLPPFVFFRQSKEQVIGALAVGSLSTGETVYEKMSGHDVLEVYGYDSTAEMRNDNESLTALANLIDEYGLDASLYRGYGRDNYDVEPMDEWETFLSWNASDLYMQRVYMNDDEVVTALADDAEWRIHQGIKARSALESALVES
jgi:hypothetical protein